MNVLIIIPRFRAMGFDLPTDTCWPANPVVWDHHPRIWVRAAGNTGGVGTIRRVILYVRDYFTPPDRLRPGYYQPKHEIDFRRPDWESLALKWLRGTGWKHAENSLRDENRREAIERAEQEARHNFAKGLVDAGWDPNPGQEWRPATFRDANGVERPCGMTLSITLRGTPKEVTDRWDTLKEHVKIALKP